MENDKLVRTSDVETELLRATERYTVAHEARGTGTVVWSDNLVSVSCALNAVRSIPAVDAVEVVRCRECRFNPKYEWTGCPMAGTWQEFKYNGFCHQGKRREEEHNAAD